MKGIIVWLVAVALTGASLAAAQGNTPTTRTEKAGDAPEMRSSAPKSAKTKKARPVKKSKKGHAGN